MTNFSRFLLEYILTCAGTDSAPVGTCHEPLSPDQGLLRQSEGPVVVERESKQKLEVVDEEKWREVI